MKKRLLTTILTSSLILMSTAVPLVAVADEYDVKIQEQDKKIEELNKKEATAGEQLTKVRNNISSIREKAEELMKEQGKLNKEVETLEKDIEDLTERIEKREKTIQEQARSMQVNGNSTGFLSIILNSDSVSDAVTKVTTASKLVKANDDLMKQQEEDKKAVETKKTETETNLETINNNAAELEKQKGELMDQELQQEVLVNEIAAERETETSKKAGFQAKKEEAEKQRAEQARLVAEANKLADEAKNTPAPGYSNGNGTDVGGGGGIVPPAPAPNIPPSAAGNALVAEAYKHIGKGYTQGPGRQGPDMFDCSGLVWYVYKTVTGRDIGGWTVPQEAAGTQISVDQAQAGDLLFWGSRGGTYHVALAIGGGQYIHSPNYGQTVCVASISSYFMPSFAVRVN